MTGNNKDKWIYFGGVCILVIWGGLLEYWKSPRANPKPDLSCNVVHALKSGDCPIGYVRESRPRFTEKDGSSEFACISPDPKKDQCMDVLKSGESMRVPISDLMEKP